MFRGLAILAVILVHTSQKVDIGAGRLALLAAYGQMGVQLFFVASAFTLCNSWQAREAESQPLLKRDSQVLPHRSAVLLRYRFLLAGERC